MRLFVMVLATLWVAGGGQAQPRDVVIFHTNDIHGHFAPEPASWRKDSALAGGVAALEHCLDSLRRVYPQSIYLDAGDLMTGNPVCNLEYNGVKGGALPEMLSRLGISAQCLGNHEFDLGADHLRRYVASVKYPLLCANLRDRNDHQLLTAAVHRTTVNGVRIGIVGLILDDLMSVVAKANVADFVIDNAAATAQRCIDDLDPETDLIILLTHLGLDDDSVLATKVHNADVIVGGHSHTRLNQPRRVNNIIIAQAGSYCKNLGVLELTVAADTLQSFSGELAELTYREDFPKTSLRAFADSLEEVIQARYGEVIGELAERWQPGYYTGSNVGNWVCDRLRERFGADVAFVNAGGLRTGLKAGPVTMLDVLELLPFENAVTTFTATGDELLKTAKEQSQAQGSERHGALEMSGMEVIYEKHSGRVELSSARIGGQPIKRDRKYSVVTIDYVSVSQADRYLGFVPRNQETTGLLLSDVITEEIRNSKSALRADPKPRLHERSGSHQDGK